MKYALVADIHANVQAWRAVWNDIQIRAVDEVVSLGDVVGIGPRPVETFVEVCSDVGEFILGECDAISAGLLAPPDDPVREKVFAWTAANFGQDMAGFFADLPYVMELGGGSSGRALCAHASPVSPEFFRGVVDVEQAAEAWSATDAQLIFVGHTHRASALVLDAVGAVRHVAAEELLVRPGERCICSVGSVGVPESDRWEATYCVWDSDTGAVAWHRVPYDAARFLEDLGDAPPEVFALIPEWQGTVDAPGTAASQAVAAPLEPAATAPGSEGAALGSGAAAAPPGPERKFARPQRSALPPPTISAAPREEPVAPPPTQSPPVASGPEPDPTSKQPKGSRATQRPGRATQRPGRATLRRNRTRKPATNVGLVPETAVAPVKKKDRRTLIIGGGAALVVIAGLIAAWLLAPPAPPTAPAGGDGPGPVAESKRAYYDFEDGLQGWSTIPASPAPGEPQFVSRFVSTPKRARRSTGKAAALAPKDAWDDPHRVLILRSPRFTIQQGGISLLLFGGTSGPQSRPPQSARDWPRNSAPEGFLGVCLRRVRDDRYIIWKGRQSRGHNWDSVIFTDAEIEKALGTVDPAERFTLDVVDARSGSWGFVAIDEVRVFAPETADARDGGAR